jgi:hypothetical protein
MVRIRQPAVAGTFYPDHPRRLAAMVDDFLAAGADRLAGIPNPPPHRPQAIIAPHAGYPYSGPVAGTAFAALRSVNQPPITRAVLIGPSHHVAFHGLAVPTATAFATPLGPVAVDRAAVAELLERPWIRESDRIHAPEHALEVELPFLLAIAAPGLQIVPLLTGEVPVEQAAATLECLCADGPTVVVVSSDLSHYLSYDAAVAMDSDTAALITRLDPARLTGERACGWQAVRGLLEHARRRGLRARTLDLRNSGDTAATGGRVVGYGAFAFDPAA